MTDLKKEPLSDGDTVEIEGDDSPYPRYEKLCVFCFENTEKFGSGVFMNRQTVISRLRTLKQEDSVKADRERIKKDDRSALGFEIHINSIEVLGHLLPKICLLVINKKKLDCNVDIKLDYRPLSLRNPRERARALYKNQLTVS